MIVALDVGYRHDGQRSWGCCGVVAFEGWQAESAVVELTVAVSPVRAYVPGRLFERELPCLLRGLDSLADRTSERPAAVIVDGNVRLDPQGSPGLGAHLYHALEAAVPVIGVAKSAFRGLDAVEVRRGSSARPLFVTAIGIDETSAGHRVRTMHGNDRLPTMLKRADRLSRS